MGWFIDQIRNERDRLAEGIEAAERRGNEKEADRIRREYRKANADVSKAMEEEERGWSESRWPERKRR